MARPKLPPPITVTLVPGGTGFSPLGGSISMGEVASEVKRMKDGGAGPGSAPLVVSMLVLVWAYDRGWFGGVCRRQGGRWPTV